MELLEHLQKMNTVERLDFRRFMASPLWGNSELYAQYLEGLEAVLSGGEPFSYGAFHRLMHPGMEERIPHLRRHFSQMLRKLVDYRVAVLQWQDSEAKQVYREQVLAEMGMKEKAQRGRSMDGDNPAPEAAAMSRTLWGTYLMIHRLEQGGVETGEGVLPFQSVIDALDRAYRLVALELSCLAASNDQRSSRKAERMHNAPAGLEWAMAERDSISIQERLLKAMVPLLRTETMDADAYFLAKKLLYVSAERLVPENRHVHENYFTLLINHLLRRPARQDSMEGRELADLYGHALGLGVFQLDNPTAWRHYQNIAVAFIRLQAYEEAECFLEEHREVFKKTRGEVIYNYCMGILRFRQGRFEEARGLFWMVGRDYNVRESLEFSLQFKAYQIACDFEGMEYGDALSKVKLFQKWMKQEGIVSPSRSSGYMAFLKVVQLMCRYHLMGRKAIQRQLWGRLATALPQDGHLVFEAWLREKVSVVLSQPCP